MDKYIGKRLDGRYEIKEIIGVGGMAYVYKAYDTIDDRIVAVKILKEEFLANEEFTRRFKNESKAIAILSHPNIVRVYDVSFGERLQYIVMEYIDGITLKEYIDQQKDIPWKEAVHFTVQILRALQHAHDKGIIHRDIKPQNIMLLADGTIKVTDFGIAQFSRNDIRTDNERAIGSVHYISPEQASGGITDEKADIYSVGVMLYEMLTGRLPFDADNAVSVAIMQMQQTPEKPRDINPAIPEGLEEITLKAMQKDPTKRYQSAAEMLYDIDEFKRNPSIHFEYTYFVDNTPTRFVEAISQVRGEQEAAETEEEEEEQEERKGPPMLPILAAVAGALLLIGLIFVGVVFLMGIVNPSDKGNTNKIDVPNLVNQPFTDSDSFLAAYPDLAKVEVVVSRQYDDAFAENTIISTDPKAGKKLDAGATLKIVVSNGPRVVQIPQVTSNEDADTYVARLKNEGFNAIRVTMTSDSVQEGCVVRTSPAYPETAAYGSSVTVFISNGSDPVEPKKVPNLAQLTKDAALEAIKSNGFEAGTITTQNSDSLEAGRVISQEPAAESSLEPGGKVNLVVASGYRDVKLVALPLPDTGSMISLEVYVDAKLQGSDKPQYSTDLQSILPSAISGRTLYFTFTEQKASYNVTFRIKGEHMSAYETYASYTINGLTGEWQRDILNSFSGGTTRPTTPSSSATTASTTKPSVTSPSKDATTADGDRDVTRPAE